MWICSIPYMHNGMFLGNLQAAKDEHWLRQARITVLVRCLRLYGALRPTPPEGCVEVEWLFPRDRHDMTWDFFREQALRNMATIRRLLSSHQNVLFYCRWGKHRSAAALACYLLSGPVMGPYDAQSIMEMISSRKPNVEPGAQRCLTAGCASTGGRGLLASSFGLGFTPPCKLLASLQGPRLQQLQPKPPLQQVQPKPQLKPNPGS